jgi:hypothetical protein
MVEIKWWNRGEWCCSVLNAHRSKCSPFLGSPLATDVKDSMFKLNLFLLWNYSLFRLPWQSIFKYYIFVKVRVIHYLFYPFPFMNQILPAVRHFP